MELLLLIAVIFLTTINLFIGLVFVYFAFRVFNLETNILPTKETQDNYTEDERLPIDKFLPKKGEKLKVVYSDKDIIHEN